MGVASPHEQASSPDGNNTMVPSAGEPVPEVDRITELQLAAAEVVIAYNLTSPEARTPDMNAAVTALQRGVSRIVSHANSGPGNQTI